MSLLNRRLGRGSHELLDFAAMDLERMLRPIGENIEKSTPRDLQNPNIKHIVDDPSVARGSNIPSGGSDNVEK
jgi:hypothetical protein